MMVAKRETGGVIRPVPIGEAENADLYSSVLLGKKMKQKAPKTEPDSHHHDGHGGKGRMNRVFSCAASAAYPASGDQYQDYHSDPSQKEPGQKPYLELEIIE